MCGDLLQVADGFRCRRCDGTFQEVDLAEDLMVDGETYECVKSFCYLGDTLDGDCGADLAATARIKNGWIKFRELLPFLTSRAPPLEMKGCCSPCSLVHLSLVLLPRNRRVSGLRPLVCSISPTVSLLLDELGN